MKRLLTLSLAMASSGLMASLPPNWESLRLLEAVTDRKVLDRVGKMLNPTEQVYDVIWVSGLHQAYDFKFVTSENCRIYAEVIFGELPPGGVGPNPIENVELGKKQCPR